MKKTNIKFFVFAAVLSLCSAACQKDQVFTTSLEVVNLSDNCQYHITYSVNVESYNVSLKDGDALRQLISELNFLAIEGYSISISNQGTQSSDLAAKDVVKIETKDKNEFDEWLIKMLIDGYVVDWGYDNETGVFHGTATKKD